jgi:hypothetical protein
MGIFKDYAENLYLVGLKDKDGNVQEGEFFGESRQFIEDYLESIGFKVLWMEKLEGDN